MVLRIGSTLVAAVIFAIIGTGLALWGINILPSQPLRVGFIALVVAVCLVALRTVARDPRVWQKAYTRARPAQVGEPTMVSIPAESPVGICWQCGSAVRVENMVCWKCGATQPQQRELLPPLVPGKDTDWDRSETIYRVPEPDILPTASVPIYRVDAPDGWRDPQDAPSDATIVEAEQAFPTPQLAPFQPSGTPAYVEEPQEWSGDQKQPWDGELAVADQPHSATPHTNPQMRVVNAGAGDDAESPA